MNNENPRILLIHSGQTDRYWAYIEKIQYEIPSQMHIPQYYRDKAKNFKTWFKIISIETAPKDVLGMCIVTSSGRLLSEASRFSYCPCFKIEVLNNE